MEPRWTIDENVGVFDVVFPCEFGEEGRSGAGIVRRKQPDATGFVGVGIDGDAQSMAFVVDPNHRLVQRDPIRDPVAGRL